MATALSMIKRAMRLGGVLGKGEAPDNDEAQDGLDALNTMLESWRLERLLVYQIVQGSYTWPASTTSRTIAASGGNFTGQRPDRIEAAFVVDSSNQTFPVEVLLDRTEYDAIVIKSTTSTLPQYLFYDPAYPLGVLYLFPIPSAQLTLKLNTWQALQSFTTLATDLALPAGYKRAIEYNLAMEYTPEFGTGRKIDPQVPLIAIQSKAVLKTLNQPSMIAQLDSAVATLGRLGGGGRYNIYSDT
jgi:hypothetical protein